MSVTSPYAAQLELIPVTEHTASVLGSTTHYWEYGDPAAGTTIVVVHGFRGDHHGLEPVVAQLGQYHLISPDLPGFGESTPLVDAAHDIDGYAAWLEAFVEGLTVTGRLVVLGHSFGTIVASGALAQLQTTLRPDDVVLVNPIAAPALSGPRGIFTRLAVFYYWFASVLPESWGFWLLRSRAIVRLVSVTMAKTRDKRLRAWIHSQHDRYFSAFSDRRVVLEAFRASVSHDVSEYASQITERTLLIASDRDDITPVSAQHELVEKFPDATLRIISGVGHLIHYEAPVEAARFVTAFLGEKAPE